MPNPILRSGPFATFSGNTFNGPSGNSGIYVNCNNQDWADRNDPNDLHKWATDNVFFIGTTSDFEEVVGLPFTKNRTATITGNNPSNVNLSQSIEFSYQAAVDFQFDLNFSATASSQNHGSGAGGGDAGPVNPTKSIISATVGGVSKVSVTDTGVSGDPDTSASYNSTLDCPASVVPVRVIIEMQATTAAITLDNDTTDLAVSITMDKATS